MELVLNKSNAPTLCLNMIVKNESKIILRLLESVLPIIDCYLPKNCDLSLITMGPKLTLENLAEIDRLNEKYYKNYYLLKYKSSLPSLLKMKEIYDQVISQTPNLEIFGIKKEDENNIDNNELLTLRTSANYKAVEKLKEYVKDSSQF
jgi:hypothetical protein